MPIVAVAGGGALLAGGLFLFLRKPGVSPGGLVRATVKFDYLGEGGLYVIQIRLGTILWDLGFQWFKPKEGMIYTLDIELPGPDSYEFEVDCRIPEGADEGTYDGECQIKTPDMAEDEYIIRELSQDVVKVEKTS